MNKFEICEKCIKSPKFKECVGWEKCPKLITRKEAMEMAQIIAYGCSLNTQARVMQELLEGENKMKETKEAIQILKQHFKELIVRATGQECTATIKLLNEELYKLCQMELNYFRDK